MTVLPDLVVLGADPSIFVVGLVFGELWFFLGEMEICSRPYMETVTRFGTGLGVMVDCVIIVVLVMAVVAAVVQ